MAPVSAVFSRVCLFLCISSEDTAHGFGAPREARVLSLHLKISTLKREDPLFFFFFLLFVVIFKKLSLSLIFVPLKIS